MLLAVLVFASVVSLAYALSAWWHGESAIGYLLLVNLRVYVLTLLGLVLFERVNLFRALGRSPALLFLLTLAYSQAMAFQRVLQEFRLALQSRTIVPLSNRDRYRHLQALVLHLFHRADVGTREITLAMRSRGFLSD